ncbi:unnamed protein product, partial [marine sediment metagenome]
MPNKIIIEIVNWNITNPLLRFLPFNPILLGLIGVVLLVGIVAGIYPAFYLSSF